MWTSQRSRVGSGLSRPQSGWTGWRGRRRSSWPQPRWSGSCPAPLMKSLLPGAIPFRCAIRSRLGQPWRRGHTSSGRSRRRWPSGGASCPPPNCWRPAGNRSDAPIPRSTPSSGPLSTQRRRTACYTGSPTRPRIWWTPRMWRASTEAPRSPAGWRARTPRW
nr:hypothetical protein [Kibdelosporangium sp. MJ126-NF4]CTQ88663.1 hypothetical protein [Kibdelosporangium sp. MJ126-NF4]